MIDFHTHIISNIDDGARNIEETYNLIKEAKNAGFEGIVLSPHYIEKYYETDVLEKNILVKAISENLKNNGIDINLYIASEIYFSEIIMNLLEEGKASTINNSCYVLFEMPLNVKPLNLYDIIYTLQENKLIPVLAHPERYSFIQKDPQMVYDLVEKGLLMQANYGSFLGMYGKKAKKIVQKLIESDLIHFLGTDVHRQNTIYKYIPKALEILREIVEEDKLEKLTTINPKLALNNKKINIDEPLKVKLSFKERIKMFF